MHIKHIKKLLKLQEKNAILDEKLTGFYGDTFRIYISKKIVECTCPSCKHTTKRIHDHRLQVIKHSPINGFKTYIYLTKTRLLCTHCNKKFYMNYKDIVNPRFRCSNQLFEKIISDLSKDYTSIKNVAKRNFVSWGVVCRYLNYFSYFSNWNKVTTLPKHIGIDEFKGNCDNSKYQFHIYDLDTNKTVTVLRTRAFSDLIKFFNNIDNRNQVELVTMDLYDTFKNAISAKFKKAIIVADRFHYTRIVSNALDSLRLKIWRNTSKDERKYFKFLKLNLLKNMENVSPEKVLNHEEKLNYAFELSGELKYGYQLYQSFLKIKDATTYEEKAKLFRDWLSDASSSTIPEFNSCSKTLLKWNKEILNSFKTHYTNSATEGKNNKIKVIKRIGYGFKNLLTFRNLIMVKDLKFN